MITYRSPPSIISFLLILLLSLRSLPNVSLSAAQIFSPRSTVAEVGCRWIGTAPDCGNLNCSSHEYEEQRHDCGESTTDCCWSGAKKRCCIAPLKLPVNGSFTVTENNAEEARGKFKRAKYLNNVVVLDSLGFVDPAKRRGPPFFRIQRAID